MLKNLKAYYKPADIKEALSLISKKELKAKIIAGGTAIMAKDAPTAGALIDISKFKLNYIKAAKTNITVGSLTTIDELLKNKAVKGYYGGLLYDAAYYIASTPLRNMITVGGNVTQVYPWSDLPLALLLTDAKVKISYKTENKSMSYAELMKKHPTITIGNGIVTDIIFPNNNGYKGGFIKFSKTNFDYAILDAGVVVKVQNKTFKDVKMGISAASPMPQILEKTSAMLKGKKTSDKDAIEKACVFAAQEADITKDIRVSVDYKRDIVSVLLRRIIERLI